MTVRRLLVALALVGAFMPRVAFARGATQTTLTGIVPDPSGAVLPGVTVEAAS